MNPLYFDELATGIIARRLAKHPPATLRLTIRHTYGRGGAFSFVELRWIVKPSAGRGHGLVWWRGPHGVPVFVAARLWRYLTWHPLRVVGTRFGPFSRLVPVTDPLYVQDMCAWEMAHPAAVMVVQGAA